MDLLPFLVTWGFCGAIALLIVFYMDYKENCDDGEYEVNLQKAGVAALCLFAGAIALIIIIIAFVVTHSETPLFKIKFKRKEDE